MRYAFTGPSGLTDAQRLFCEIELAKLKDAEEWTTGAALGLDSLAHIAGLRVAPNAWHRIVVPAAPHNEDLIESTDWAELVRMPRLTNTNNEQETRAKAYRARNNRMLDFADELHAFLRWPEFYRSGEWMTVNLAEKRGIPVVKHILP